mmetsp:Transcript_43580/g.51319  ORF Transcript_43580/g.51319 Transcript_43580/m.51319 type:complete len:85 (+) Transcript_43580:70-324(+)
MRLTTANEAFFEKTIWRFTKNVLPNNFPEENSRKERRPERTGNSSGRRCTNKLDNHVMPCYKTNREKVKQKKIQMIKERYLFFR